MKAARDFFEARYAEDPMHDWSNADELAVAALIAQARRDGAAEARTPGTIEVCLSCRESTLLWDPRHGVCGGGAGYYMCPMMEAIRARGEP